MRRRIVAAAFLLLAGTLHAADRPLSADAVLEAAKSETNGRAIFVVFGASW